MIVIKKSKNGQFCFVVKAANGQVLATSEMYTRKSNCLKGKNSLVDLLDDPFLVIRDETTK